MSFIDLVDVTMSYTRGEHRVTPLQNLDLTVEQGEFFVLLGPSGSGKTTLLNLVAGIDRPDSGTVMVAGKDVGRMQSRDLSAWRAENVGYVFQQYHLVPVLSAYENIELPLHLFGMTAKSRHERVSLALEAVGLTDRHNHYPRQLSGGQQQRVAIARAIVADPPLLVTDEPTGDLDHDSAESTLKLLRRFNQERGKTIVMVTHDVRAAAYGSHVLALDKGKLTDAHTATGAGGSVE